MTATDDLLRTDVERATASRPLIPSVRELELGGVAPVEFVHEEIGSVEEHVPLATQLRTQAREMNPFSVVTPRAVPFILLLFLLNFVENFDGPAFGILAPELQDVFNVNLTTLINLLFIAGVAPAAISPFMGYVLPRVNRKATFGSLSAVRWGVGGVATAAAPGFGAFVLSRVLGVGVGSGAVTNTLKTPMVADRHPGFVFNRVNALIGLGAPLGAILGPLLGGRLAATYGPMRTIGIIGTVGLALSLAIFLLRDPKGRRRGKADRENLVPFRRGMADLSGIRTMRLLWLAVMFMTVAGAGAANYLNGYYFDVFNLGPIERGNYLAMSAVGGLVGLLAYGPLADRFARNRPSGMVYLLAGLMVLEMCSLLGIAVAPTPLVASLLAFVPNLTFFLFFVAIGGVIYAITPPRLFPLAIGVFPVFLVSGLMILLPVVTYATTTFGYRTGVAVFAPFSLIAAGLFVAMAGSIETDMRSAAASERAQEEARRAKAEGRTKLLVIRGLEVAIEGAQILHGVDLDVHEGEIVALLGTNGAGKSTLLRSVAGIFPATVGAVFLDGEEVTRLPSNEIAERGVVMMPGGRAVFPTMTVEENLRAAAWTTRSDTEHVARQRELVLELFPTLRERLDVRAGDLSGGEQQMVGLSQALIMRPRLLMIDELSLGLAPDVVERLLDVLRRMHADGTTIVLVEQSVNVALTIADRAVYMEQGQVKFDGATVDLVNHTDIIKSVFLGQAVTSSLGGVRRSRHPVAVGETVEPALEVRGLRLSYGGKRILDDLSLSVQPGEVVGVVGPNGAGKTSLFDAVAGFAAVSAGEVLLGGRDVTTLPPDQRAQLGLARSYQNVRLFPSLTVRENIAVALERHVSSRSAVAAGLWLPPARKSERRVSRRVENLIESMGLRHYADFFVKDLSTGTRRIVDIACVLGTQPQLLLLDEPSSGLAQAETESLGPLISRIVKETGCGVLLIEHDLGLVAAVSDRLVAIRLGTVMAHGEPHEVLDDPEVMAALLGGASEAVLSRSVSLHPSSELAAQQPTERHVT